MRTPLETLLRKPGRPLLLLAESERSLSAVLVERRNEAWECLGDTVEVPTSSPDAVVELLAGLDLEKVVHAVLASAKCGLVLHPSDLPKSLTESAASDLLRWEIDFTATPDSAGVEIPKADWRIGHAPAGVGQTAVALIPDCALNVWREALVSKSVELAAVVPASALGQALLDRSLRREGQSTIALATRWQGGESLAVFERGKLEFHAAYPAGESGWSRGLVSDARSFAPERFVATGVSPNGEDRSLFNHTFLPATEWIRADEDWPWSGLLASLELSLADATEPFPRVLILAGPRPIWSRPLLWWAGATLILAATALPLFLSWSRERVALEEEQSRYRNLAAVSAQRLEALEGRARTFEDRERELREMEERIEKAARLSERPAAAPCARVEYLSASLRSLSTSFTGPVRLLRFRTDFEGHLAFSGETETDYDAQEAAGRFYVALSDHPIRHSPLSTTREGAPPGRFVFHAEQAGLILSVPSTQVEAEEVVEPETSPVNPIEAEAPEVAPNLTAIPGPTP